MGDFTALPVDSGVGDYHFNRFRIAFQAQGQSAAALAADLIDRFPKHLKSAYAEVLPGGRSHEGKPTIHFHGNAKFLGLDLAKPHDDWVVQQWVDRKIGFTAQTLKREFFVAGEDVGVGVGVFFIPGVGQALGLAAALGVGAIGVHYNRMHFLAGRRSWRISQGTDFGLSADVIVLETVAIERFSALAYNTADALIGVQTRIPDVWIEMLNNFVKNNSLTVVPQTLRRRWKNKNRVDYIQLSFASVYLNTDWEVGNVLALYPTILPATSPVG
jgi:hypothetical protein